MWTKSNPHPSPLPQAGEGVAGRTHYQLWIKLLDQFYHDQIPESEFLSQGPSKMEL